VVRLSALLFIFLMSGVNAMAHTPNLSLTWQWGGTPAGRVAITVGSIEKQGGGLFGINQSPSIAGNLPDARIVTGEVVAGDSAGSAELKIPAHELPSVKPGDVLAIMYTSDHHAVCVAAPPVTGAALPDWLKAWECPVSD
jgi:hypothetical protein